MSLRFATANTDFAKRGDARYLDRLTEIADVLLLQEAKDNRIADHLPKGWVSLQDTSSKDRMGACIVVDGEAVEVISQGLSLGVHPILFGRLIGMLTRWIAWAILRDRSTGRWILAVSAHEPPFRFRLLQPLYTRRLRRVASRHKNVVIGTDANMPIGKLGLALGLDAYGKGIVGLLSNLSVSRVDIRPWGLTREFTDHPAVSAWVAIPHSNEEKKP